MLAWIVMWIVANLQFVTEQKAYNGVVGFGICGQNRRGYRFPIIDFTLFALDCV